MYEDDVPPAARGPRLDEELLREVALSGRLRPRLAPQLVARLQAKLQRTAPGYAPTDASELLEWVKERVAIPLPEWLELLDAVRRDAGVEPVELDPVSRCGLGLEGFSAPLPRRAPGNHMVFHASRLVVTSEGSGRRLTIAVGPVHPHLVE